VAVAFEGAGQEEPGSDTVEGGESPEVPRGVALPRGVVCGELPELHREEGGLEGVDAEVTPDVAVVVFRMRAVDAEDGRLFGEGVVIGDQHPGVAEAPEVLRGEKAVGAECAEGARLSPAMGGSERLRGILDDGEPVFFRQGQDAVHVGGLSEKVHRDDGPGARRDEGGGGIDVEVEAVRARVGEDGSGPDAVDAAGGGKEGEGRTDHLVAGANAQGHQGEEKRVGARGDAERVPRAGEVAHRALECRDLAAQDVGSRAEDADEGLGEFGFEGKVLGLGVKKGDVHPGNRGGLMAWERRDRQRIDGTRAREWQTPRP